MLILWCIIAVFSYPKLIISTILNTLILKLPTLLYQELHSLFTNIPCLCAKQKAVLAKMLPQRSICHIVYCLACLLSFVFVLCNFIWHIQLNRMFLLLTVLSWTRCWWVWCGHPKYDVALPTKLSLLWFWEWACRVYTLFWWSGMYWHWHGCQC